MGARRRTVDGERPHTEHGWLVSLLGPSLRPALPGAQSRSHLAPHARSRTSYRERVQTAQPHERRGTHAAGRGTRAVVRPCGPGVLRAEVVTHGGGSTVRARRSLHPASRPIPRRGEEDDVLRRAMRDFVHEVPDDASAQRTDNPHRRHRRVRDLPQQDVHGQDGRRGL